MFSQVFTGHEGLGASARFPTAARVGQRVSAAEWATLVMMGAIAAAASMFFTRNLGIAGHNVLRVVFPMAFGLALVPRRGAGSIMGASAAVWALALSLGGANPLGPGALSSLALTGLVLDLAVLGARPGWTVYVRLAGAGLAANMVAFGIRAGAKCITGAGATGKPLAAWWPEAMVTYAVCGALAGLLSAAVWFRFAPRQRS